MTALSAVPAVSARPHRVLIVSGSVGAGHDGAARELADRLRSHGIEVDVRDYLAAVPRWFAVLLRDGYSTSVDHVPGAFQLLFSRVERRGPVWRIMRAMCALGDATVAGWLTEQPYDAVVSTYPMASQCLGGLRERGLCAPPLMTYLTDPSAHRSWVHPAVDQHVTVTAATAAQGSSAYGIPMVAGGPLVPARFGERADASAVAAVRRELSLAAGRRVALLVAGSLGIGDVVPTVEDVVAAGLAPLVLCGRNERLRARVAAVPGAVALGWRTDVHVLMALADVLVHNAGGLSFTEAMVAGLPAVTYRPIPGHGRANAVVLEESGLAPWARTRGELWAALELQLHRGRGPARLPGNPTNEVLDLLSSAAVAA